MDHCYAKISAQKSNNKLIGLITEFVLMYFIVFYLLSIPCLLCQIIFILILINMINLFSFCYSNFSNYPAETGYLA